MPSKDYFRYIKQCKIHHKTSKTFSGNGVLKHGDAIVAFAREIGATSGIDYGCGKGDQYRALEAPKLLNVGGEVFDSLVGALGFEPYKFDPAVKTFSEPPPAPADLVWCTDVMEHIPATDIPFVVSELFRLATKGVFVTVATYPAKKTLPNGENAHICIRPEEWWREHFDLASQARPEIKLKLLFG